MDIDFVTDAKKIDKKFVDRLFNLTDLEEVNAAYEESTCQILRKFKTSFLACVAKLHTLLSESVKVDGGSGVGAGGGGGGGVRDVQAELKRTAEYIQLQGDKVLLLAQLAVSTHDGAEECRTFLNNLPDILLLKGGCGEGAWAREWGDDLK